jgi:hypothetical protein
VFLTSSAADRNESNLKKVAFFSVYGTMDKPQNPISTMCNTSSSKAIKIDNTTSFLLVQRAAGPGVKPQLRTQIMIKSWKMDPIIFLRINYTI